MWHKIIHNKGWSWYAAKTPWWLMWYYKKLIWRIPTKEKIIYLTFDDGPIPKVTEYVLATLAQYKVKASFFCIGKNVVDNPTIYQKIIDKKHSVGNHTYNHLNGWKTPTTNYLQNINEASNVIHSNWYRPPYGRITKKQIKALLQLNAPIKIIMWDVLSGDFDTTITPEKCYRNVINNVQAGSIIVFHDSEKAYERLLIALPKCIEWLLSNGYTFKTLDEWY